MKNLRKSILFMILALIISVIPSKIVMAEVVPYKYVDGVKCINIVEVVKLKGEKVVKKENEGWGKGYELTLNGKLIEIYEDAPYMFVDKKMVSFMYEVVSEDGANSYYPVLENPIKDGQGFLIPMYTVENKLGIKGSEKGVDIDELKNPSKPEPEDKPNVKPTPETKPENQGPKEWPKLVIKPSGINPNNGTKLNQTRLQLNVGKSYTLKLNKPNKKVIWTSDDPRIAKVSSSGVVTGVSNGTTAIRAKVDGYVYACNVLVEGPNLNYNEISVYEGSMSRLYLSDNNSIKGKYSIDNKSIANIDYIGTLDTKEQYIDIKANKVGTTKLTVKVGNTTLTCNIKVIKKNNDLKIAGDKIRKAAKEYGLEVKSPNHIEYYPEYHPAYDYASWISLYDDSVAFVIPSSGTGNEAHLGLIKEFICTVMPEEGEILFKCLFQDILTSRSIVLQDKTVKIHEWGGNRFLEIINRVW